MYILVASILFDFLLQLGANQPSWASVLYTSRPRASMVRVKVGLFELELPYIADIVGTNPKNQQVKNYRKSDLGDIVLGMFYEFKRFPKIKYQTRLVCSIHQKLRVHCVVVQVCS